MTIAVLMTCFNRCDVTLACLERVAEMAGRSNERYDVFLVDDGSTDGTSARVAERFPWVRLLQGTGALYWCGGMRKAWEEAVRSGSYDVFVWLNDDVTLDPKAFEKLEQFAREHPQSILAGACADPDSGETTYGFLGRDGLLAPQQTPVCLTMGDAMNGNCVWIPRCVYERVGSIHPVYQHSRGDSDYGWRALMSGFPVLLTPFFVGTCPRHDHVRAKWQQSDIGLHERWRAFNSPKGVPFAEYVTLNRLRFPLLGWGVAVKWVWLFAQACIRNGNSQRPS